MQSASLVGAKALTPFQASRGGQGGRLLDLNTFVGENVIILRPARLPLPLLQASRSRATGGRRRGVLAVRAAAVADTDVNLGALLRDALTTSTTPAQPAVEPAPSPMPEAAPAPPPAPVPAVPEAPPAASVTVDPVPGTEILSGAPQPQPPPAPTQGMDFVLQQLQDKPPMYGETPKAAAKPLADGLDLPAAGKGLDDAGAAAAKSLAAAADGVTGALGGAADSVGSALGGAADAAADAQAAAAAAAAQAAAAATAAADAARDALTGVLGGAGDAAAGAAGGVVTGAQQFLDGAASEFSTEVSIIKSNIDSLVGGVTGAVGGATSSGGRARRGRRSRTAHLRPRKSLAPGRALCMPSVPSR